MITLTLKEQPNVPLEAETIAPDVMATLTHDAVRALPVQLGKRQRRLDDFFEVEGEASDEILIKGDRMLDHRSTSRTREPAWTPGSDIGIIAPP